MDIHVDGVSIHYRHGGEGQRIVLLDGSPQIALTLRNVISAACRPHDSRA